MTVTEDGLFLETDPGVGIRQPGWHFPQQGAQVSGIAGYEAKTLLKAFEAEGEFTKDTAESTDSALLDMLRLSEDLQEEIFQPWQDESLFGNAGTLQKGMAALSSQNQVEWASFQNEFNNRVTDFSDIVNRAINSLDSGGIWFMILEEKAAHLREKGLEISQLIEGRWRQIRSSRRSIPLMVTSSPR